MVFWHSPGALPPASQAEAPSPQRLRRASKADPLRLVFPKQAAVPDIAPDGGQAAMSGLVHDGALAFPGGGGGGGETRAQAVAGKGAGIETKRFDVALHHNRDSFAGQAVGQHSSVAVHPPEQSVDLQNY
jgi:hypothetical protein